MADTETASESGGATTLPKNRKQPRPEIQLYRPGMLRKGESTKSLANDEKPPRGDRPESVQNRRLSNDRDSIKGGSGSTTPDANAMNDKYRRFGGENDKRESQGSSYNSTQSLYDTRKAGGYVDHSNGNYRRGGDNFRSQRQPFERSQHRNYNERSSMRGDGAISKRTGGGRRRNDSINSTQSEMPQSTRDGDLQIDTSYESASQCAGSIGEGFSFEEMCQSLQSFTSMDWSKEVENDWLAQQEQTNVEESDEKAQPKNVEKPLPRGMLRPNQNRFQDPNVYHSSHSPRGRNRRNRGRDDSDRESSFGGSIAEEDEDDDEVPKSGERTPTSTRESYTAYHPRQHYQQRQLNQPKNHRRNNENGHRQGNVNYKHPNESNALQNRRNEKPERKYRGEHDDRDDEEIQYDPITTHQNSERLAGRLSIVKRDRPDVEDRRAQHQQNGTERVIMKRSEEKEELTASETADEMNREQERRERFEKFDSPKIKDIADQITKIAPHVAKKRDVEAAKKIVIASLDLAQVFLDALLPDIKFSFTTGLEQQLFKQAFHKPIDALRTGSNSPSSNAKLIRAALQRLLLDGITFYESLIKKYEENYEIVLNDILFWKSGFPTDVDLTTLLIDLPCGIQKLSSPTQKIAVKSLSRHLVSLGDLHRYKTLVDGSENYSISQSFYLKSTQLWPSSGHPYNQLGVVSFYSMLYRSARRARLIPIEVLSRQRQTLVIDEIFFLTRAMACSHPYEASKDRLSQRISAMRAKVSKYEPLLDSECGKIRDEVQMMKKMEKVKEIWVNLKTGEARDDSGGRVIEDVLQSFMNQSSSKLHRRAVSYLIDTFGMLITKVGMDHFQSVSERAFALLFASLSKKQSDFSARHLVQIATLFLYAVNVSINSTQLLAAVRALTTFQTILLDIVSSSKENIISALSSTEEKLEIERKALIILPAANLVALWMSSEEGKSAISQLDCFDALPSTILHLSSRTTFESFVATFGEIVGTMEVQESVHPEVVFISSFFKSFGSYPIASKQSSHENSSTCLKAVRGKISNVVESCDFWRERISQKMTQEDDVNDDDTFSHEKIVDMERKKGSLTFLVRPENVIADTNVFIDHLNILKSIVESKDYQLVVPTTVMAEISGLCLPATSRSEVGDQEEYVRENSKVALAWLKEMARNKNSKISTLTTQGKKIGLVVATEDTSVHKQNNKVNDDMILESCTQYVENYAVPNTNTIPSSAENAIYRNCVLLTEDRGLTIKAISKNIPCRHVQQFKLWADL